MSRSFILTGKRSAVVPRHGAFANLTLHDIASPVVTALLKDGRISADRIGELIVSNALGVGGNPARRVALASGLPERVAGLSIDRQCCGGLDALLLADAMIRSGQHDVVLAGGVESYSRRPMRAHTFADGSPPQPYEQAPFTPWPDRDPDMAEAADALARKLGISRQEQEDWAIESHTKALAARDILQDQIVEIEGLRADPFARHLSAKLCARAPVNAGSITSATMCVAADAAAFCLVVSERVAKSAGGAMVELISGASVGDDPQLPGLGPVPAIKSSLQEAGLGPGDLDVAEIMEAFAVQAIACQQGADIDPSIVNPLGGSLARGHPIGASGAILAVSLFHQLKGTTKTGLAAIAAAGGLGTALVVRASADGL